MKTFYAISLTLLVVLLAALPVWATHIRAGEVTARQIGERTYEFTITTYTDQDDGRPANQQETEFDICFGDGTPATLAPRWPTPQTIVDIGNSTARNIYKITHTFPGPGVYVVSAGTQNRNAGTVNLPPPSDNISWYVETIILINPTIGQNTTPVLLNPGVDFTAVVGQRFIHNPGAFDAEGDSLAYRLTVSRQASGAGSGSINVCRGLNIRDYRLPNEVAGCAGQTEALTGAATFSINPLTGDLIWDAPACPGQYNVAFVVEEWRGGVKIGEVTRDMQIIVEDRDNKRPEIQVPPDLCVEAGTRVQQTITATDRPNSRGTRDRLTLSAISAVFGPDASLVPPTFALFTTPAQPQAGSPATGQFVWQTNCAHVRAQPYTILFKVQDNPGSVLSPLVDSKTFNIRVVAPRPRNLRAEASPGGRSFVLTWEAYACGGTLPEGVQMVIYRREGCDNREIPLCETAPPAGYVEVGRVPIGTTTFTDTNGGRGFTVGGRYSYRIQAQFPAPQRGSSAPSDEFCANLPRQVPYITNVTVDRTDASQGEITVRWTRPFALSATAGGPYEYRVLRVTGLSGNPTTEVARIPTDLNPGRPDTVLVERALNTVANAYRYRVVFYFTQGGSLVALDSTEAASSVRLSAQGAVRSVALSWQANVPWQNQRHRVFRQVVGQPGVFNQIADVTGTSFTDTGADQVSADGTQTVPMTGGLTYCYRVQTVGSYPNAPEVGSPLLNFSQVVCASPIDTTRPCPPVLALDLLDCPTYVTGPCEQAPFANKLSWSNPATNGRGEVCGTNIIRYNVYYKRYAEDEEFAKIDSVTSPQPPALSYTHAGLPSYAGCYYVTAVNSFGNESPPSNVVCKDNCPAYTLPNVFTPNSDGQNDVFQPMNCPRFVRSVRFVVYNRWGVKVFEHEGDPLITWAGVTTGGQPLPSGTYYYEAEVVFERLSRQDQTQTFKGWIQLLK